MVYKTGNPVGSTDPRDLYDNASNLDKLLNGPEPFYADRLGKERRSWSGMQFDFEAAQDGRDTEFQEFLENSGYEPPVSYAAGITLQRVTQTFSRDGVQYRIKDPAYLPYTLTGNWASESENFSSIGDGALRQDLSGSGGADLIGFGNTSVGDALSEVSYLSLSGVSDVAKALEDFTTSLSGKLGRVQPGNYVINRQVDLPGNVDLDLTGVTLDFSAAPVSNFPNLVCLRPAPGSLTLLPALSAAPTVGTFGLSFSESPNLSHDDLIVLHDDTPYSYSGFRSNYYQGQFSVVRNAAGTSVSLTEALITSLPVGVKAYKINPVSPRIRGGRILMPTTGVMIAGAMADLARNPVFHGIQVLNASGGGLVFQRTFAGVGATCDALSDRDGAAADNYGFALANCQDCHIIGGRYQARRHGVTLGGNDLPGCVPTRFCVVDGAHISSWNIQGADMHGNVESCQFVNCIMGNGVTISGNMNSVRNCTVIAPVTEGNGYGVAISLNELRGTSFSFENLRVIARGNPGTSGRGVIDAGGNSNAMTDSTILGGVMAFRNIEVIAPNALVPIKIVNRGSTAVGRCILIRNVTFADSPTTRQTNLIAQNASGTTFNSVDVNLKFPNVGAPAGMTIDANRISGLRESGTASATSTATAFLDIPVTFNRRFPKAPSVRVQGNQSAVGVNVLYAPMSVTVSGFTARIYTVASNMTAGITVTLMWEAVIDE